MITYILNEHELEVYTYNKLPKSGGVYYILNTIDNKIYIGSSRQVKRRIRAHLYLLNANRHPSKHLQSAWNRDGLPSFIFGLLEHCKENRYLTTFEQFWIDTFQSAERQFGYNLRKEAINPEIPAPKIYKKARPRPIWSQKITEQKALEIKNFCSTTRLTPTGICKHFKEVSKDIVMSIYYGKAWTHLLPSIQMPPRRIIIPTTQEEIDRAIIEAGVTTLSKRALAKKLGISVNKLDGVLKLYGSQEIKTRLLTNFKNSYKERWTVEERRKIGDLSRGRKMTIYNKERLKEGNLKKVKELRGHHTYDPAIILQLKTEIFNNPNSSYKKLSIKYKIPSLLVSTIASNKYWAHFGPQLNQIKRVTRTSPEIKAHIKNDFILGTFMDKELAAKYKLSISTIENYKKKFRENTTF